MEESKFKFYGYRVSKVSFTLEDSYKVQNEEFNQNIEVACNYDTENNRLVEVKLDITINSKDNALNFFVSIKGGFEADKDVSDELFDYLSKHNAPAILYPFARAIITNYTAQANIPPIILPAINFAKKPDPEK